MIANNIVFSTNLSLNKRFFRKLFDSLKNIKYLFEDNEEDFYSMKD